MKHFTLFTCLLAFLFISCGGDDEPEPLTLDDPEHIEPQTDPAVVEDPISKAAASSIQLDESGFPNIAFNRHKIEIDEEAVNIPLPELVIDIDDIIFADAAELDHKLGAPISVVELGDENIDFEIRYYHLFDGNVVGFWIENDERLLIQMNRINIHYLRGYLTSIEAVKAAGFAENEVTLKGRTPEKVNHQGAKQLAKDLYSAQTENEVYDHIFVVQRKALWYNVYITRRNPRCFDDGKEVECE